MAFAYMYITAGLLQQDVVMLNIFPNCDKLKSSRHMEFIFIVDRSGRCYTYSNFTYSKLFPESYLLWQSPYFFLKALHLRIRGMAMELYFNIVWQVSLDITTVS